MHAHKRNLTESIRSARAGPVRKLRVYVSTCECTAGRALALSLLRAQRRTAKGPFLIGMEITPVRLTRLRPTRK